MDWTDNALALTTDDRVPLVVSGSSCATLMPVYLPGPMEVTYTAPCRYCRCKLALDCRFRCQNCGAPEHLAAAEWGIPFITVPPERPPKCTQGGTR